MVVSGKPLYRPFTIATIVSGLFSKATIYATVRDKYMIGLMANGQNRRVESDGIHLDMLETREQNVRLGVFSVLDILAMPASRGVQQGRPALMKRDSVTKTDMDRYEPEWQAGRVAG